MSEILQISKCPSRVDDITGKQYHTYTPYTTSFNNNDEIRIAIQSQDLLVQPSESYLFIEFNASQRSGKAIGEKDATFTHTCGLHFFSEMRYELNGIEIDRCKSPAITSQLKTMLACKSSDMISLNCMTWLDKTYISTGSYQLMIPLKFVFGLLDDYNKVLINSKHELVLLRSNTDTNAFITSADTINFNITKICWKIPHITLSDYARVNMLRTIERKLEIPVMYRSWDLHELPNVLQTTRNIWSVKTTTQMTKPRYVVVAFQTNRNNVASANPKHFDHCNISNMRLYLNNDRYPYDDMNLNFNKAEFCETFNMLNRIQHEYYNGTEPMNPVGVIPTVVDKNIIFFTFDCSRSDENITHGMVDVRIEMDARENFPANTTAYCLIIHDNLVRYCPATSIVRRV